MKGLEFGPEESALTFGSESGGEGEMAVSSQIGFFFSVCFYFWVFECLLFMVFC